jgi:predicted transcriptional regulator
MTNVQQRQQSSTFRLGPDSRRKLEDIAFALRISRTEAVRRMVDAYHSQLKAKGKINE